jgi:signal transduction histidine kinase
VSYAKTRLGTYAAELAAWAVLATGLALFALAVALVLGALGSGRGVSPSELWAGAGTSFHGKLHVAFVLIALVPIASLAFLIRGIVIQQLERDIEQEGLARAQIVENFVVDFLNYRRADADARGAANVTDAVLEWVGGLAGVDVDLYASGELVATSKPELFGSGLLRTRAPSTAYRELLLEQATHSIHRESVGSFEYLVVSVPLSIEPWQEPGILALPLASQKNEIDLRVSSMNQTLLLTAFCFALAAAALASALARRIAGPINTLTEATHRVAEGHLDVSLETESKDEIGALFASFTQMAADLKRQRSDLERTKKLEAWAEMARQVAHEVKNPLTPIQLAAEHLLRVHDDPNVDFDRVLDECTATILQQVKSLRQISMEFSTFASPDELRPEPTDIEGLVRETVEPYVHTPPDGVRVRVDIAENLPVVRADARLLKRTLLNLVENALNAINGAGSVTVHVAPESSNGGRFVEVAVADTGVGIDPELKERIFEPYFSTRAAGTGLGLAIAKKVVEDHGGSIELESEPGRGTVVRMKLPITPQSSVSGSRQPATAEGR